MSICPRDERLAIQTLEWAHSLDGVVDYDCVLSLGTGVSEKAIEAARKYFRVVTVLHSEPPIPGNPQEKNWTFQNFCRWIYDEVKGRKRKPTFFLWLEPDSIPLKKGWLKTLEKAHREGGKEFSGCIYPVGYMACVGIYPWNFMDFSPTLGMTCRAACWDQVAAQDVTWRCQPINELIQCVDNIDGFPPTFEDKASLAIINSSAVLFHRNKDGTLVERLSEGRWPRIFTFASKKAHNYGVVSLRRAGDIINLLPAIQQIAHERKKTVRMVVHEQYAGLFDGVSYAEPELWKGDFEDPLTAAEQYRAVNAQVIGRNVLPDWRAGNFAKDAWKMLGRRWNRYAPVQFDRRVAEREQQLAEKVGLNGYPTVLVKLESLSSPMKDSGGPTQAILRDRIQGEFGDRCHLVWLDEVKAERLYDLIGLMDRAACLVSVDTVALHLAAASTVPTVALLCSKHAECTGFSATPPKGNQVLRVAYPLVLQQWNAIASAIGATLDKTVNMSMVLVYAFNDFNALNNPDTAMRNARAKATWHQLGARLLPFTGARDSSQVGDMRRLVFVKDMAAAAFSTGDEGICVLTNNDIEMVPALAEEIRRSCVKHGCFWSYRVNGAPGASTETDGGVDVVAFTRSWWALHSRQFPDLLLGQRWWDNILRRIMIWSGCAEGKRLYYHRPHLGVNGRLQTPGEAYNVRLAREWRRVWQEDE